MTQTPSRTTGRPATTTSRTDRPSVPHTSCRTVSPRGVQPGPEASWTTRSACLPASTEPIRSPMPMASAPAMVASSKAAWAPKRSGSTRASRAMPAASAAARRMSLESPALEASHPSATRPPRSTISAWRPWPVTPWPSRR